MVVAGFAAHTDINKAHEVANEVRRVNKQLKECQQLAAMYNNRERLFEMPITNVRQTSQLPNLSFCVLFIENYITMDCGKTHSSHSLNSNHIVI